jgi:23S rRNA pseudouridine1911/1915/1917 synthase
VPLLSINEPILTARLVIDDAAGMRLDLFLAGYFNQAGGLGERLSRSEIQRLIGEGQITLNNKKTKASTRIRCNDRIDICLMPPCDAKISSEALPLEILYEDGDCIVINKAAGMTVHPAAGNWSGTLVNALLHHCPDIQGIGGIRRPGIVHRLDKETSGVMIVAKKMIAYQNLVLQFKNRSVEKEYVAVAWGNVTPDKGVIDRPVGRHRSDRKRMSSKYFANKSREAVTEWAVAERFILGPKARAHSFASLLRLRPQTGRTHQIRVHLADSGYPLIGDRVYGKKRDVSEKKLFDDLVVESFPRHALHAEKLTVNHVRTGQPMQFVAPLPEDLTELLRHLRTPKSQR